MRFLLKVVTICFEEKEEFDYNKNHRHGKLANFRLDNISKIDYKMLVVLSYISSRLGSRKIQLVQRIYK